MRIDAIPWEAIKILDKMSMQDIDSISDVYRGVGIPSSLAQARMEKIFEDDYGGKVQVFHYKRGGRQGGVIYTVGTPSPEYDWYFFAKSEADLLTKLFVYEIHDV